MARAADDGYEHALLPGLRSSVDAARLADELAFAAARLRELAEDPPGLYADVALAQDPEEAAWLAFLIAYLAPLEGPDPWAGIAAARVDWASGELPDLDGVPLGPRAAHDPGRGPATLVAYRAWAARAGSQAAGFGGEAAWPPQRRFDRAFERLALPGFGRAARYELLVILGALGVFDLRPWSLHLSADALDPTVVASKRALGIGDPLLLQRRASELAGGVGVPIEALDLALVNWSRSADERVTAGATASVDAERRAAIGAVLGV
jgi:alpha-glutamyl/putrescinyl thymine pyrophosphorylase-like protein